MGCGHKQSAVVRMAGRSVLKRADARLSVSLVAVDLRAMCILLTGADSERARPREAGTEKMANFDRFLPFSAALEKSFRNNPLQWPKTAGIDQASHGQWVRDADLAASPRPTQHCRTES